MNKYARTMYYISFFLIKTFGVFAMWHLNQMKAANIIAVALVLCDAVWAWLNPEHSTFSTAILVAVTWMYACAIRVFLLTSPLPSEILVAVWLCTAGALVGFLLSLLTASKRIRLFEDYKQQKGSKRKICGLLLVVPLCGVIVFSCIRGRKIDRAFENNVLVNYYCAVQLRRNDIPDTFRIVDIGKRSPLRTRKLLTLYEVDGLDPNHFLFATRYTGFGDKSSITRIIMHPDAREPLEWLAPRLLKSNTGEMIVTDKETLEKFCEFLSDPQNGTPAPDKLDKVVDPYTDWAAEYNIYLYFELPYAVYWQGLYEMQDGKVILYAHHHATNADYAYDVTHILGEYFDLQ